MADINGIKVMGSFTNCKSKQKNSSPVRKRKLEFDRMPPIIDYNRTLNPKNGERAIKSQEIVLALEVIPRRSTKKCQREDGYCNNDWVKDFANELLEDQPEELIKEKDIELLSNNHYSGQWFEWNLLSN
ncbi:uncharacterized protein LOC126666061 [Mercurialis annua]|uniref:uncharacterized protein LOC126666061 n=1 Tax=Mercurialis annua TaxID=3986 RepID=UPI00215DF9CF|nr:uncharacterized protein LOC126666061 [Mercurialis annua]